MDNGWFFLSTQHLNDMGNFIFTQGLPIFYAIYDAFFHTTFPTSNGLYTTFPTSKIVVNFCQTTTYCGRFPRKSDPTDLSIRTIGKENPGKPKFSGEKRTFLALGELRRATGGFEAVFLALLHTRIAREEAGLLQDGAILGVDQQQGAGHAVAQSAGLTGHAAALDGGNDVDLAELLGSGEGLTDDHLQGLETEILVDVAAVDGDSASAVLEEVNAGDGGLSTAGAVQIRLLGLIHSSLPP